MNLDNSEIKIMKDLLSIEHKAIAKKLGFIPNLEDASISDKLLMDSIGLIDKLSRIETQTAKRIVITLSAILWTYKNDEWDGLKDILIVNLSRAGFPPSAIMLDDGYEEGSFSSFYSIIDEFLVTLHQLNHEIDIKDKSFLVTGFQKRVWDKLKSSQLLGISAPTSAGKSFIILLKAIELLLEKKGNIIYIVPTLSLVSQVSADFNYQLKAFNLVDYRIATTYNPQEAGTNKIYVLTQEKAISAFSQNSCPFDNIRMLVVDEIQNIEHVSNENDQRAKILYDTLIEFRYSSNPDITVISGPRVDGLKTLGIEIFNDESVVEEKTKDSPVASFTYSVSKKSNSYLFNQYSNIFDSPNKIKITNPSIIKGYGGVQYRDGYVRYLTEIITNLGPASRNIVFMPTAPGARKTAIKYSNSRPGLISNRQVTSLVEYLKETVHDKYDLCHTLRKGVVYHHGKMPTHVRAVVERAIRDKLVNNVFCTTTLLQGVNLPAQNVIIRNPDLSIKANDGVKPKLSNYEIANLRGRAGRLLKDFIGRTFVLDENSFDKESEQAELFQETEKELHSGYGATYLEHKDNIDNCLIENIPPSETNKEYSFLLTYIRQVILKHKSGAQNRLQTVGIELEAEKYEIIRNSMASLNVPEEICYKNRYWDPIDLNKLYNEKNRYVIPTSINSNQIEDILTSLVAKMRNQYPFYYKRYFDINEKQTKSICISAKEWVKETSLKDILSSPYYNTPQMIEERISLLQNKVSFGLPMLLKPLYDMKVPDNPFISFIETGAYNPITRRMIELNIPRETAIFLTNKYFRYVESTENDIEKIIITKLNEIKEELDYWKKIQIETLLR
ncbi:DEAD/DEAH box helicase [Methanococcoides sp. SA1]|nr:DEAD/DEAH box helicase [Methanococcoides sp. SA1]